jgi:hypothetical protein
MALEKTIFCHPEHLHFVTGAIFFIGNSVPACFTNPDEPYLINTAQFIAPLHHYSILNRQFLLIQG